MSAPYRPMTRSAARLALAAGLLLASALPAQDTVRVVTLDQAIELSLRMDPTTVAARSGVTSAEAGTMEARGAWLPALNSNFFFNNSSNERFDATSGNRASTSYTAQLQASYEIFSGGRRTAQQALARADLRAAEADLVAREYDARLATTEAFYQAAAAEQLRAVAAERVARAEQQLSFARTRLEVGTATRSDILRAELELGNARAEVIDAQASVETSRLQLARRIGVPGPVRPAAAPLPQTAPALPADEALAARAEAASPLAVAASADESAARAASRASWATYLPSVRATAGYDWFSLEFPPETRSWNVRLTASLPLFNNFSREADVQRARAASRTAEARARDARLAARADALAAAAQVRAAGERAQIAARAVELAREDLRVQEERYQLGASTILELLTSQVALSDAEVALVRARQTLASAVARLEAVVAAPVESL